MNCDNCGKDMTDENGTSIVGVRLSFHIDDGIGAEFLQKQLGPYEIREYNFCYECWLRSMGASEPDKEVK